MLGRILGKRQLLEGGKMHAVHRLGSFHARPRRAARSMWGSRVGPTARQRVARWVVEFNMRQAAEADALGIPDAADYRPGKKWSERIKEARRATAETR